MMRFRFIAVMVMFVPGEICRIFWKDLYSEMPVQVGWQVHVYEGRELPHTIKEVIIGVSGIVFAMLEELKESSEDDFYHLIPDGWHELIRGENEYRGAEVIIEDIVLKSEPN